MVMMVASDLTADSFVPLTSLNQIGVGKKQNLDRLPTAV